MDAKYDIPSIGTLVAFEATARLGGMNRAAREINSARSAISRYVRHLESTLGVPLFVRKNRGLVLTKRGEEYFVAVQSALEHLHAAGHGLRTQRAVVTIACTQEVSVLLLGPVFSRLKRSLPDGANIRILTCDYDMLALVVPTGVDITFEYSVARTDGDSARILDEAIVPVASPSVVRRFGRILRGHPRHWCGVPRLEVASREQGWATWMDWFDAHECVPPHAPIERFENYFQLLEAAANGDGIAIGWNGFMGSYFSTERLVPLGDEWLVTKLGLYAVVTPFGGRNPDARGCLRTLASLSEELADDRDALVNESRRQSFSDSTERA